MHWHLIIDIDNQQLKTKHQSFIPSIIAAYKVEHYLLIASLFPAYETILNSIYYS